MFEKITSFFTYIPSPENPVRGLVQWLSVWRWFFIFIFFLQAPYLYAQKAMGPMNLVIYLATLSIFGIFNLFSSLLSSQQLFKIHSWTVLMHLILDMVFQGFLLSLSGGFSSPLGFIALFPIIVSSLLLKTFEYSLTIFIQQALLYTIQASRINNSTSSDLNNHGALFLFEILIFAIFKSYANKRIPRTSNLLLQEKQDRLRALGALTAGFAHEFASPLNAAQISIDRGLRKSKEVLLALKTSIQQTSSENKPSPKDHFANKSIKDSKGKFSSIEALGLIIKDLQRAEAALHNCKEVLLQIQTTILTPKDWSYKIVSLPSFAKSILEKWQEENPKALCTFSFDGQEKKSSIPLLEWTQVFINLLDNALEAQENKLSSHIEIMLTESQGHWKLSIKDEGMGFSPLILEHIGEPFLTTKKEGTGLGLYMSHLLAHGLGGHIYLENHPTGALVTLQWPENSLWRNHD